MNTPAPPAIPTIPDYPLPRPDERPADVVTWTVDPARAALLIHDMQRFFLAPFGADSPLVSALVTAVAELRSACVAAGVPVLYTAQPGRMEPQDRGLLADFWGPGMESSPQDRAIVDELAPGADDVVLTKWRYSAFQRTDLLDRLRSHGRDQLVVCGVYAHVGCLMTCVDAFSHDIQPFLVADAVADFTHERHRMALSYAAERCAATPDSDTVRAALGPRR
ncbi:isochorismatase family protein [Pseudonocardia sp. HH130630-07]|uniref:isochorismatase family protein n=1 Tax=Pseudonocardia sp. HH130630-07 TaxID=1690815 RepID=UPI0008150868|nr:isochorismatase family protein [Pseudonocardia sp. HH130630-07]ANY10499.1 isochorismatase [Pseudonocardia sp. HH130630-07]